jgi:hypothetical protein
VGLKSLKSLNLTNVYPNNKNNKKKNNNNNKVKSKPLELRSRVKTRLKSLFSQKPRDPSPLCVKTQEYRITKILIFNN